MSNHIEKQNIFFFEKQNIFFFGNTYMWQLKLMWKIMNVSLCQFSFKMNKKHFLTLVLFSFVRNFIFIKLMEAEILYFKGKSENIP